MLGDELAFKLSQCRKDAENLPALSCGGVDRRPLASQDFQINFSDGEVMNDIDQVAKVPARPVELPDEQGVTRA